MEKIEGNNIIWKTENFIVFAVSKPFISREEGGHMIIRANGDKYRYDSRLDFSPSEVLEQQRLCQMISKAYKIAMKKRNIEIVRINYFEAGNWAWKKHESEEIGKAHYHEHIFGRTLDSKKQKFPDAPYLPDRNTGFYDGFEPLNEEDIECIIEEMKKLENDPKYEKSKWQID